MWSYVLGLRASAIITVMSGFSNAEILGLFFVATSVFKITKYKYNRKCILFLYNSCDVLTNTDYYLQLKVK